MHHRKQEIRSSSAGTSLSTLHWAAFFSDVEHEVLSVGEGYRDTLTYNLSYHSKPRGPIFDVKTSGFYILLQTTLGNLVFMREGGVLGFILITPICV